MTDTMTETEKNGTEIQEKVSSDIQGEVSGEEKENISVTERIKAFIEKLKAIYFKTLKIIFPLIFLFLCYQTCLEISQDRPIIKPFEAPPRLLENPE